MAVLDKVLRAGEGRILRKLKALAEQVNALEDDFSGMTDADLRAMTEEFPEMTEPQIHDWLIDRWSDR